MVKSCQRILRARFDVLLVDLPVLKLVAVWGESMVWEECRMRRVWRM